MTIEPKGMSPSAPLNLKETAERPGRRARLAELREADEEILAAPLLAAARLSHDEQAEIEGLAWKLVERTRRVGAAPHGLAAFLQEYDLTSEEGVILMCLAEALLRIPDTATADRFISDKVAGGDWAAHLGRSPSFLVNASTFGLVLTGRLRTLDHAVSRDPVKAVKRLVARAGEPILRQGVLQAVRLLGRQFILGRTIGEAMTRARKLEKEGALFSFDMLGEAARSAADAERYHKAYDDALDALAQRGAKDPQNIFTAPGISVKLSALHPRYEFAQRERILRELVPRLARLAEKAAHAGLNLTIDAEEAARLELMLDVFEVLARTPALSGWNGLGIVVQAYQKRAPAVIDLLAGLARATGRRLPVRLVKGAYWDTEIKRAQEQGLEHYPVFTRKIATDVAYLGAMKALLTEPELFHPQFATHNAHTMAAALTLSADAPSAELQRLHGMGDALFETAKALNVLDKPVRIYAPVGEHEHLLSYLVRRLLENGANSSFVHQLSDESLAISAIVADPARALARATPKAHPRIPRPRDIFGAERRAAKGYVLDSVEAARALQTQIDQALARRAEARPLVAGKAVDGDPRSLRDPADRRREVGTVIEATGRPIEDALASASGAARGWSEQGGAARADLLARAADLFEEEAPQLIGLCVREAGKTLPNAIGDVREAVDFLRYYAARAREHFADPLALPERAGERNTLRLDGRGVFACISPWNFPLAIFTGQVAAALAAGNAVIVKPAEQTPLVAYAATRLLHRTGVPADVLHLLPGAGETVGQALVSDPRIAGIAFTGSTDTARAINRRLAERPGPIIPFIAETGGLNAMIADSSALVEQVVDDAVSGAFDSAGQRCSATRVLFLQDEIADRVIALLGGAMAELKVGDPMRLDTDIGPVIDDAALKALEAHAARMMREAKPLAQTPLGPDTSDGFFFAPRAFEIERLSVLPGEVFGPILHVVRYRADRLHAVVDAINESGYGLTLGLHTRIDATLEAVRARARVGNLYVNRNQIGAVVGAQPFGGEGLSGTGPKAGGPHYLYRFATERTLSIDTSATGGNTDLYTLGEND